MPIPVPGSEFNDFLFEPIAEDQNGMLVSVLSGFARCDVDPLQEAARLAQLAGESAARRSATLLAGHQLPEKTDDVEKNATDPASPQPPPTNPSHSISVNEQTAQRADRRK